MTVAARRQVEAEAEGLVVLISGRGSNLQALLASPLGQRIKAVLSDNADAAGLAIAKQYKKPVHVCSYENGKPAAEQLLSEHIARYAPVLIALAGFMRVLSEAFIRTHGGRIVNIHPSLLPAFRGLDTHRRVLVAGCREHGCTVHWVNAEVDAGDIIDRAELTVAADDDEHSLARRVLQLEHDLYPQVLERLLAVGR